MTPTAEPPTPPDLHTGFVPPDLAELARQRAAVEADLGARYRVGGFIARGGFASVWHAVDTVDGQAVAVKRIDPKVGRGRDFFRELRAMFLLDDPHVVRIVNFLDAGAARYLILELCSGGSLRPAVSALRRGGPAPDPAAVAETVRQIAAGLAAAHKLGLTHRDLKPENVLFAEKRRGPLGGGAPVKLADFGLATLLAADDAGALKALTGSPAYMAPEQFAGRFTPASDVYALGVIAYELLTRDLPFSGSAEELAYQHLRQAPALPADLPGPWADLLPALLDKVPENRPTADAVARLLGAPRGYAGPPATAATFAHRALAVVEGSAGDFLGTGPDGYTRLTADGRTEFTPVPGLTAVAAEPDGDRVLAGRTVYRRGPDGRVVRLAELPAESEAARVFAADGRTRAVWHDGTAIVVHDLDADVRIWDRPVPVAGLPPKLARLADGGFACSDFVHGPGLRFFGADGGDRGRVPLPGLCWQVRPWPGADGCALRVLTGSGFQAFRASPAGTKLLPDSTGVAHLAAGRRGGPLYGGWANGAVAAWQPDGTGRRVPLPPEAGDLCGLATDGRRIALLRAADPGSRVAMIDLW